MVNLGWVPAENKLDISMGSDPIGIVVILDNWIIVIGVLRGRSM